MSSATARTIAKYFKFQRHVSARHERHHFSKKSRAKTQVLVGVLARAIVELRCSGATKYADAWKAYVDAGTVPSARERQALRDFLGPALSGRDPHRNPPPETHTIAAIAEYLWYFLTAANLTGPGVYYLETPKYEVTDKGPDGIAFYQDTGGGLSFRIWEVKQLTGAAPLSSTARTGGRQLEESGAKYVAQYTAIGASHPDPLIRAFCADLYDHWLNADAKASAGIAVATSHAKVTTRSFSGLGKTYLRDFSTPLRLVGFVATTPSFRQFALDVRDKIWSAL